MSSLFSPAHLTEAGAPPGTGWPTAVDYLVDWRASLQRAGGACCCPARPTVVAIMPPVGGRTHPVDLLLCRHHGRAHAGALAAAGAAVLDADGEPLTAETVLLVHASG
jgi:hypothetical protein